METKVKASGAFVLLLVVICLGTVLALVWTMPDLPTAAQTNKLCLTFLDGALKCSSEPDLLGNFLNERIEHEYNEIKEADEKKRQDYLNDHRVKLMSIYDTTYWEMKPAAKLTGVRKTDLTKSDPRVDMEPIREWCQGKELQDSYGFQRYGIRYRNGRIVVPVDGTYFIYSFLDLFESCDPKTGKPNIEDSSKPIKHGVYKFNILDEEERELVSNVQPHAISSNKYFNSYDSYVSTLATLKAGDELSIKVSNITYLKYSRHNYFGINLI